MIDRFAADDAIEAVGGIELHLGDGVLQVAQHQVDRFFYPIILTRDAFGVALEAVWRCSSSDWTRSSAMRRHGATRSGSSFPICRFASGLMPARRGTSNTSHSCIRISTCFLPSRI